MLKYYHIVSNPERNTEVTDLSIDSDSAEGSHSRGTAVFEEVRP